MTSTGTDSYNNAEPIGGVQRTKEDSPRRADAGSDASSCVDPTRSPAHRFYTTLLRPQEIGATSPSLPSPVALIKAKLSEEMTRSAQPILARLLRACPAAAFAEAPLISDSLPFDKLSELPAAAQRYFSWATSPKATALQGCLGLSGRCSCWRCDTLAPLSPSLAPLSPSLAPLSPSRGVSRPLRTVMNTRSQPDTGTARLYRINPYREPC